MTNEDAIRWLDNLKNDIGNPHYERLWHYAQAIDEICYLLKEQQPKTARWEKRTGMMPPEYHGHYWCSNCEWHGRYNEREADYKFCPACGAKMEKHP